MGEEVRDQCALTVDERDAAGEQIGHDQHVIADRHLRGGAENAFASGAHETTVEIKDLDPTVLAICHQKLRHVSAPIDQHVVGLAESPRPLKTGQARAVDALRREAVDERRSVAVGNPDVAATAEPWLVDNDRRGGVPRVVVDWMAAAQDFEWCGRRSDQPG